MFLCRPLAIHEECHTLFATRVRTEARTRYAKRRSGQRDGDVDAEVSAVGKQLGNAGVEDEAVAAHDGRLDALMDAARRGLPGEPALVAIELEPVDEVVGLLARANELHHSKELLVAVVLLLFFQHQHEVVAKARLHHHPVDRTGQVDVCRQEHNVLALECRDRLVRVDEVRHHLVERALPLARRSGARAQVRPELAGLFVFGLVRVGQQGRATRERVFAREEHRVGHFLHGQVADVADGPSAGGATGELLSTRGAHEVAVLALKDGGQHVVEADGALKQAGQCRCRTGRGRRRRTAAGKGSRCTPRPNGSVRARSPSGRVTATRLGLATTPLVAGRLPTHAPKHWLPPVTGQCRSSARACTASVSAAAGGQPAARVVPSSHRVAQARFPRCVGAEEGFTTSSGLGPDPYLFTETQRARGSNGEKRTAPVAKQKPKQK